MSFWQRAIAAACVFGSLGWAGSPLRSLVRAGGNEAEVGVRVDLSRAEGAYKPIFNWFG